MQTEKWGENKEHQKKGKCEKMKGEKDGKEMIALSSLYHFQDHLYVYQNVISSETQWMPG